MKKYQLSDEAEALINAAPLDNRQAMPAEVRFRGQARCAYWLQPRLHTWIQTHILDVVAWNWRQFTEAAVLAAFSPDWVHPTWHHNYVARGFGNQALGVPQRGPGAQQTHSPVGWTPFLDEIPLARESVAGIEPHANPANEHQLTPEQTTVAPYRSQARYDSALRKAAGGVVFDWHSATHAFLGECARLTPTTITSTRVARARRGDRTLSASEVARVCVTAHFERGGVHALREAMLRVWREYALLKSGMQDHVPTVAGVWERMQRYGVGTKTERVPLWAADQGEHLPRLTAYECGFWPQEILRKFHAPAQR